MQNLFLNCKLMLSVVGWVVVLHTPRKIYGTTNQEALVGQQDCCLDS